MARPGLDHYLMGLAQVAATRTTCIRRGVGCVLADAKGRVLSIGYNGVASGLTHCNQRLGMRECLDCRGEGQVRCTENIARRPIFITCPTCEGNGFIDGPYPDACQGHDLPPGQDQCEAVHAEQNAILQCRFPWDITAAYVTLSPCKACLKLLLNTSCTRIVFLEEHVDPLPRTLWEKMDRLWIHLS